VVAVAGAAGLASGCGDENGKTIRAVTGRPHLGVVDLGARGKSHGDLYVFDSAVFDAHGRRVIGRLRGTQMSIKLEQGAETVQGILTFEFGGGNSIVVGGLSQYPRRGTGTVVDKRFVRAVLGGTGKYAGATGTVTTKRGSDGRYEQEFRLQD